MWEKPVRPRQARSSAVALDLGGYGESVDAARPSRRGVVDAYARDVVAVATAVDAGVLAGTMAATRSVTLEGDDAID